MSKAWDLIHEHEEKRRVSNPFKDMISVEVYPKENDVSDNEEMVELTLRVPEQFFTQKYLKSEWDKALKRASLWDGAEYLTDNWRSDIDVEQELYGPDGQQVPLW